MIDDDVIFMMVTVYGSSYHCISKQVFTHVFSHVLIYIVIDIVIDIAINILPSNKKASINIIDALNELNLNEAMKI